MRVFPPLLAPSWARLGALLGRLGPLLGPSWGPPGLSGGPLGLSWCGGGGFLGRLQRRESRQVVYAKNARFPLEFDDFWPLEAFLGVLLETSWGPLVLSCSRLGHLGAIFGRRGAFLDRLGGLLELSWPVLEPSGLRNSHARNPGSAQERPEAPRSAQERPGRRGSGPLRN